MIYDLPNKFKHLDDLLLTAPEDTDMAEAIGNAKLELLADLDNAMDYLAKKYVNLKALTDAREEEIARLKGLQDAAKSSMDNYRDLVKSILESAGIKKYAGKLATFSVHEGRDSVYIYNESEIPEEYLELKPAVFVPVKTAISKAIKDGKTVPGAKLVKGPSSLHVK